MGINGLYKYIKNQNLLKSQYHYNFKRHNIVDFNNILFQKFLYNKSHQIITPQMKVSQILSTCNQFTDSSKYFYIVLDPMGDKNRTIDFDFTEYNKLIYPNKLNYNNIAKILQIVDPEGNIIKELDMKQIKRNRHRKQNKINNTQTNEDILKIPIYNYIIIQQYFKYRSNVKIINAPCEADISIALLVKQLLSQHIHKEDISIISHDSDMISYSNGVSVQYDKTYIETSELGIMFPEYLFICGSTYFNSPLSVDEFIQSENQQELYEKFKKERIEQLDLAFIISDIIYVNYDIISSNKYTIDLGINSLHEAVLYNLIFLQKVLHMDKNAESMDKNVENTDNNENPEIDKIGTVYLTLEQIQNQFPMLQNMRDVNMTFQNVFNNNRFIQHFRQEEIQILELYKQKYPQL